MSKKADPKPRSMTRAIHNHIIIENNVEPWNKWNIVSLPTKRVKTGTNTSIFPNYHTPQPFPATSRARTLHQERNRLDTGPET